MAGALSARGRTVRWRRLLLAPMMAGTLVLVLVGCEPDAPDSALSGVSCPTTSKCIAVGATRRGDLAETTLSEHGGSSWSIAPTPNHWKINLLDGVSCLSSSNCMAVGQIVNPTTVHSDGGVDAYTAAISAHWNGSKWTLLPTPSPTPALNVDDGLVSVSCTSTTNCMAVGDASNHALSERWNGAHWSTLATPAPPSGMSAELISVSCYDGGCMAVGTTETEKGSGSQHLLTEKWDGTSWTVVTAPEPVGADDSVLEGVSCSSATACMAVGGQGGENSPLTIITERWDGTAWTLVPSPSPSGSDLAVAGGISCPSATSCTAVGFDVRVTATDFNETALVDRWNGSSWKLERLPLPAGTTDSALIGVSCPSVSTCTAVGSYGRADQEYTLAERWTSSSGWKQIPSANPRIGTRSQGSSWRSQIRLGSPHSKLQQRIDAARSRLHR